jgi:phosphatidylserine decarboxylase
MLPLASYGRSTILAFLALWAVLGAAAAVFYPPAAAVPLLGAAFTLYFFRDPRRAVPDGEHNVVSPADGTVVEITELPATEHIERPVVKIGIFLSVLDVHVNRAPCAGRVRRIDYRPGIFLSALNAASSGLNEANSLLLETLEHGSVLVRQIAGKIARRIVCAVSEGEELCRGQKIGMIKFGSRTELYLERERVGELTVSVGQKVKGGHTILARFRAEAP